MEAGEAVTDAPEDKPKDPVASIAGQIAHLSTGDRALLRRLYLTEGSQSRARAGDGVVIGLRHRAGLDLNVSAGEFEAWKLLAHFAAVLSGTGGRQPHAPGRKLGTALHAAGLSEHRFLRLTSVRGAALHEQLRLCARLLAQAGQAPVNLWPVLQLAGHGGDEVRIRIAQDYYAAAARSEGDAQ